MSDIRSACMKPESWHACTSTIEYPYLKLFGHPLRMYYITRESVLDQFKFNVGLTVRFLSMSTDKQSKLSKVAPSKLIKELSDLAASKRLLHGINGKSKSGAAFATSAINERFPLGSRIVSKSVKTVRQDGLSELHINLEYCMYGLIWDEDATKGEDIHFHVTWIANDTLGTIFEIVFQSPTSEFEKQWKSYGQHMKESIKLNIGL
jgi:hypothetical protein